MVTATNTEGAAINIHQKPSVCFWVIRDHVEDQKRTGWLEKMITWLERKVNGKKSKER